MLWEDGWTGVGAVSGSGTKTSDVQPQHSFEGKTKTKTVILKINSPRSHACTKGP